MRSPVSGVALLAGLRAATGAAWWADAEAQLTARLRASYAPRATLLTESGTTALTAALVSILQEHPSRPVAIPAYACYDLATVADGVDAPVFLYDVDPNTLAPDLDDVAAALQHGAAAVIVAHLYGLPLDVSEVNRLAAAAGAVVIEDAAQAAGATLQGRAAGTLAPLAILSFGRGKGLTGGSGGALMARDDAGTALLERARGLLQARRRGWREVATIAAQLVFEHPMLYALPASLPFLRLGETIYRAPGPLREVARAACAMVAASWDLARRELAARQRNAQRLLGALRAQVGGTFTPIQPAADSTPGYLRLPLLASPDGRRAALAASARRLGIMPGYPKALCDLVPFNRRITNRDAFPGARQLAERLCTLPTHGRLGSRDLARLEAWIGTAGRSL